jgi:hypothetical protein
MIAETAIILATFSSGAAIGYALGERSGNKLGRDQQWIDSYFDEAKREKQKRDKDGKFKRKIK